MVTLNLSRRVPLNLNDRVNLKSLHNRTEVHANTPIVANSRKANTN